MEKGRHTHFCFSGLGWRVDYSATLSFTVSSDPEDQSATINKESSVRSLGLLPRVPKVTLRTLTGHCSLWQLVLGWLGLGH